MAEGEHAAGLGGVDLFEGFARGNQHNLAISPDHNWDVVGLMCEHRTLYSTPAKRVKYLVVTNPLDQVYVFVRVGC